MASVSHGPAVFPPARPQWVEFLKVREMWASLAISMMWLAVLFDAVYGPNIVSTNGSGASSFTCPSAIIVAFFAFLATRAVARYAFGDGRS